MEIIRYLFSLLSKEDPELYRIFFAWIRRKNIGQVRAEATVD
jgi:hypothetical protein